MTQPPPQQPPPPPSEPPPPPSEPPPTAVCTMCRGQLVPGYLGSLANKMAYADVQWFEAAPAETGPWV